MKTRDTSSRHSQDALNMLLLDEVHPFQERVCLDHLLLGLERHKERAVAHGLWGVRVSCAANALRAHAALLTFQWNCFSDWYT